MQTYNNIGYWLHQFTDDELTPVWEEINRLNKTFDTDLVNHKCELVTSKPFVEYMVNQQIARFNYAYNYPNQLRVLDKQANLKLNDLWVNWMSKHEFSPIHNHQGVMSFVIWMRIPYTKEEEQQARPYVPENINFAGEFALHYTDTLGQIRTQNLPAYRDWTNGLCLFPSPMQHSVFPYYSSNELRISIAGNMVFNTDPE